MDSSLQDATTGSFGSCKANLGTCSTSSNSNFLPCWFFCYVQIVPFWLLGELVLVLLQSPATVVNARLKCQQADCHIQESTRKGFRERLHCEVIVCPLIDSNAGLTVHIGLPDKLPTSDHLLAGAGYDWHSSTQLDRLTEETDLRHGDCNMKGSRCQGESKAFELLNCLVNHEFREDHIEDDLSAFVLLVRKYEEAIGSAAQDEFLIALLVNKTESALKGFLRLRQSSIKTLDQALIALTQHVRSHRVIASRSECHKFDCILTSPAASWQQQQQATKIAWRACT